jgi:hypothetical protein
MKYDKDVGVNWHLRFRLIIQELKEELELTLIQLEIAERKLKKYENDNIRAARDRKNNNVIKLGGRISEGRDQT